MSQQYEHKVELLDDATRAEIEQMLNERAQQGWEYLGTLDCVKGTNLVFRRLNVDHFHRSPEEAAGNVPVIADLPFGGDDA